MTETITNLPEVREIEEARSKFLTVALSVKVSDQETMTFANQLFLEADDRVKAIDNKLDKNRKRAYESYQDWLKLIKELKEPYLKGKTYLNSQIVNYKKEIDRIRDEEIECQRQKAIKSEIARRKEEENTKLTQAAELEKVGAHIEAGQIIAEAILESVKPIEPYIPPPATQKVELQGAAVRETWKAEIIEPFDKSLRLLCQAIGEGKQPVGYVDFNMPALNLQARSLKAEMRIPGVKPIGSSNMVSTGRSRAA